MIHTCNKREWYVYQFIIPSLLEQGIKKEQIIVWHDYKRRGNLKSWLASLEWIRDNFDEGEAIWHFQDDILIARDWKERAETFNDEEIVCGFMYRKANPAQVDKTGRVAARHIWFSFPCIKIPVFISNEFLKWFDEVALFDNKCFKWYKLGKGDDTFFVKFIREERSRTHVINVKPCLVQHVDWLIGGSQVNQQRKDTVCRAYYWNDQTRVEELREALNARSQVKKSEGLE